MTTDRFTRRAVNQSLLAFAVSLAAGRPASAAQTRLFDFAIAGGWHHALESVRSDLTAGERLMLRAEPDNPHDSDAVAVLRAGLKLGYIPRAANTPIARLLAAGQDVRCDVVGRLGSKDDFESFAWTSFVSGDPRLRLTVAS